MHKEKKIQNTLHKRWITWATYHANITEPPPFPLSQSYTLPLFMEFPTSPTMAWHAMKILSAATKYLNPHQTPVMVGDQRHKCCLWPRSYNGNSLKHNLVKIISWSYLAQCIQQNKRPVGHYNPRPVRVIEIGQVHPSLLSSHILFYSIGSPIEHIFLIRSSWTYFRDYPSLKPRILFCSNGLAIWRSFPDITHINVNNNVRSAILNLIELRFFKPCPSLKLHCFCS